MPTIYLSLEKKTVFRLLLSEYCLKDSAKLPALRANVPCVSALRAVSALRECLACFPCLRAYVLTC